MSPPSANSVDMTGRQIGELTVLRRVESDRSNRGILWHCRFANCEHEPKLQGYYLRQWSVK